MIYLASSCLDPTCASSNISSSCVIGIICLKHTHLKLKTKTLVIYLTNPLHRNLPCFSYQTPELSLLNQSTMKPLLATSLKEYFYKTNINNSEHRNSSRKAGGRSSPRRRQGLSSAFFPITLALWKQRFLFCV